MTYYDSMKRTECPLAFSCSKFFRYCSLLSMHVFFLSLCSFVWSIIVICCATNVRSKWLTPQSYQEGSNRMMEMLRRLSTCIKPHHDTTAASATTSYKDTIPASHSLTNVHSLWKNLDNGSHIWGRMVAWHNLNLQIDLNTLTVVEGREPLNQGPLEVHKNKRIFF